ncbi:MAG TPA: sigma-70 family RNA polymerase sigma factor [Bacteroidia bacterium]|jgi:RNA polymerase sigma factor (sigma-70 family)
MKDALLTAQPLILKDQNINISETVRKERSRLLDFIRRRVPEETDAEDILQDVFYQLVETYRLMKPIEQVTNWLFTVARNKITDLYRKKKAVPLSKINPVAGGDEDAERLDLSDLLPSGSESPEMADLRSYITEELEKALEELPAEQRDVFVMHEIEDKSFNEIAEITGESVNTLLSRKRYAVLFLRKRLKKLYEELAD